MKQTIWTWHKAYGKITFLSALLLPLSAQTQHSNKRNVLFICVDDLRTEVQGYKGARALTPNLDRLAQRGRIFTNHYVQVPTSGASRAALLTGKYPDRRVLASNDGVTHAITRRRDTSHVESFIQLARVNGYRTEGIGKIGHSPDGYCYANDKRMVNKHELPNSWDSLYYNDANFRHGEAAFFGYADGTDRNALGKRVAPYECADVADSAYADGNIATLAVERIQAMSNSNTPTFLCVGFYKPHLPFNAPKRYWDLYNRDAIELTDYSAIPEGIHRASLHNSHEIKQYILGDEEASLNTPYSEAYARKLVHAYLACVSYVDAQIGKVLDALEQTGQADNTLVVVWGDHGWHLGEHSSWGKHTLMEVALNSTLIMAAPNGRTGKCKELVETVDLYPTFAQWCGINAPEHINGRSLLPLLTRGEKYTPRSGAYSYFNQGISVRSKRYRLTKYYRNAQPVLELYDYKKDRYERTNIAPFKTNVVNRLLPLLEAGDTGLYQ
ncbi:MAG: sulfatase [Marinifilaceae bacterium]